MEQTFFSLLVPGAQVTNRRLMSECIANNFGGSRDLEKTFIHSFFGSSIQHSLSIHHVVNTVLGTENSAKHTRHSKILAYILVGKGRQCVCVSHSVVSDSL